MKRVLILSTILLATVACSKKEEPAPAATASKEAPALPADVATLSAAPAPAAATASSAAVAGEQNSGAIVATGEFVTPVRSELSAKIPGRVLRLYVDEGSQVRRGQPVLEIETEYVRLNLQRAEADAQRAAAAERDAARDLERKKELIGKQSIPQATYDRTQATYEQARAMRQSSIAQAAIFRQQLSDSTLRSPIDGIVAEKRTDVGQRLGDNTVALVIVQISPLKLRFRVPEKYLAQVRRGQTVKATTDPYPGQVFTGRVTTLGGVIDPATRSFFVETEFPNNDGRLKPGLFARVEMEPAR
jgi:membrane fusion protein (multidrug efflux system)